MEKQVYASEIIVDILHERVGIPPDIPDIERRTWCELGVDSLGLIETLGGLEQALTISIPLEQGMRTTTIEELVSLVDSLRA